MDFSSLIALFALGAVLGTQPALPISEISKDQLVALSKADGHTRIIHVWASWCRPCVAEWPRLSQRLAELSRLEVDVVAVALEREATAERARQVLEAAGFSGRNLWAATDAASMAIDVIDPRWDGSVPTTYLIGPDGKIVLAQRGRTRIDELGSAAKLLVKNAPAAQH